MRVGLWRRAARRRFDRAMFLEKTLEGLRRVFPARRTQREASLFARGKLLGVRLADIATGTAVELGHRRHEPSRKRFLFRKLEPIVERHRGVMPRKLFVRFDGRLSDFS